MTKLGSLICVLAAAIAVAATATSALAATPTTIGLGPAKVAVDPNGYRFKMDVRCPAGDKACVGVLGVETAGAIKPYRTIAAKKWDIGAFSFTVPAGKTKPAVGKVYGAALAELLRVGTVKVRAQVRDSATSKVAVVRVVTFTLKR